MDDDHSQIEALERRLEDLEARNEALEARLEHNHQETNVTRRRALAGVLGGAVFGAGAFSATDQGTESDPRVAGSQGRNRGQRRQAPNTTSTRSSDTPEPELRNTSGSRTRDTDPNQGDGAAESSGLRRPSPGNVQSAIDDLASTDGRSIVRLTAGETYSPDSTWELKRNITLDYNGARVSLASDIDLVHLHPNTSVLDAYNRIETANYTSTVFTFDSAFDGGYGPWGNTAVVRGGFTDGNERGGTLFKLRSRADESVFSVRCVRHDGFDFDLIADFDSGSASNGTWMNSNRIEGTFGGYHRGVHLHGANRISENEVLGWWQTGWDCEEFCLLEGDARGNYVLAAIWDAGGCANAPIQFGSDSDHNVVCSLVPYRGEWPEALPIEYSDSEGNIVLDAWELRSLLSEYSL